MKILLAAVNAQYIHVNPAVRSLAAYARQETGQEIRWVEFTINQHAEEIVRELYRCRPEWLGFSCYIWNYEIVRKLCGMVRERMPGCRIFLGGPEVSSLPGEALRETGADFVLTGEGEQPFAELCRRVYGAENGQGTELWNGIPGAAWQENGKLFQNPEAPLLPMDALPFFYEEQDPALMPGSGRILYYECSRGCPFQCQYCLSGQGSGVRRRSLELVFAELSVFLQRRVPQVKLVDRTFNADRTYALQIWKWLAAHDNGVTNFHFELAAELLSEEELRFLQGVRPGLFQFEIGVQSANVQTLRAVRRSPRLEPLTRVVRRLQAAGNIHLHLDLIAGLPFEDYVSFGRSFDFVYAMRPDQLQLGFLKLLKGSGLYADRARFSVRASAFPPYEVLSTPQLSYGEILRLKMAAHMVELYYNTHRYERELSWLEKHFSSPFSLFEALGDWYEAHGYHRAPHAKAETYTHIREFAADALGTAELPVLDVMARYDFFRQDRPGRLPEWMEAGRTQEYKEEICRFFNNEEMIRTYLPAWQKQGSRRILQGAHLEVFPFDPRDPEGSGQTALLFDYRDRDLHGNAAVTRVLLEGRTEV